jgi:hypothetical protein
LERKVGLHALDVEDCPRGEEYYRELREVNRLLDTLGEKGTDRDRLIEGLYNAVTIQPRDSLPVPFGIRRLSLEEFQQFRSAFESMPDEGLAGELGKAKAEHQRKWDEIHKRNHNRPPSAARP